MQAGSLETMSSKHLLSETADTVQTGEQTVAPDAWVPLLSTLILPMNLPKRTPTNFGMLLRIKSRVDYIKKIQIKKTVFLQILTMLDRKTQIRVFSLVLILTSTKESIWRMWPDSLCRSCKETLITTSLVRTHCSLLTLPNYLISNFTQFQPQILMWKGDFRL